MNFRELKERYSEENVTMEIIETLNETEGLLVAPSMGGFKANSYVITDADTDEDFHVYLVEEVEEPVLNLDPEEVKEPFIKTASDVEKAAEQLRKNELVEEVKITADNLISVKFKQNEDYSSKNYGKHYNFNDFKLDNVFYEIDGRIYKEVTVESLSNGNVLELVLNLYQ